MKKHIWLMCLTFFLISSCAIVRTYEAGREYLIAEELYEQHDYSAALETYRVARSHVHDESSPRWRMITAKITVCEKKAQISERAQQRALQAAKDGKFITARTRYREILDEYLVPDDERADIQAKIKDLTRRIARARTGTKQAAPALEREVTSRAVEELLSEGDALVQQQQFVEAASCYQDAHDLAPDDARAEHRLKAIERSVSEELDKRKDEALSLLQTPYSESNVNEVVARLEEILEIRGSHQATRDALYTLLNEAAVSFYETQDYHLTYTYLKKAVTYATKRKAAELQRPISEAQQLCNKMKEGTCK